MFFGKKRPKEESLAKEEPPRIVLVNVELQDDDNHIRFPDNAVHTAKYNVFNFIPRNLFEQFRKVSGRSLSPSMTEI